MPSVTVKDKQTILDIAILYSGDVSSVFDWLKANGSMNITDDLISGQSLETVAVVDLNIVNNLKARVAKPASADDLKISEKLFEGIDYWAVEDDFVVQ